MQTMTLLCLAPLYLGALVGLGCWVAGKLYAREVAQRGATHVRRATMLAAMKETQGAGLSLAVRLRLAQRRARAEGQCGMVEAELAGARWLLSQKA